MTRLKQTKSGFTKRKISGTEKFAGWLLLIGILIFLFVWLSEPILDGFQKVQDIKSEGYKTDGR